jgi:hypothetical protein
VNHDEFNKGIKRVTEAFKTKDAPGLTQDMASELARRWLPYAPGLWDKMCSWVIDNCRFRPRPADFNKAYEATSRSYYQERSDANECQMCDGTGFMEAYYLVGELPYQGVRPCSVCNTNFQYRGHKVKAPMRDISYEEYCRLLNLPKAPAPSVIRSKGDMEPIPIERRTEILAEVYSLYPESELLAWMLQDSQKRQAVEAKRGEK